MGCQVSLWKHAIAIPTSPEKKRKLMSVGKPVSNLSATATEFVYNPPTTQQHEGSLSHSALPFSTAIQCPTTKKRHDWTQILPSALPFTPKIITVKDNQALDRLRLSAAPPASTNITNSPISVFVSPQTVKEQKLPVKVDNENGDDLKESFQDQINRDAAQLHSHVKSIILHAIDDVFHPLDDDDNPFRRELVSLKKLEKGDCSWSTIKVTSTHVQFLPCLVTSVHTRPTTPKRHSCQQLSLPFSRNGNDLNLCISCHLSLGLSGLLYINITIPHPVLLNYSDRQLLTPNQV